MLCSEVEIGVGENHDGIMVLPEEVTVGTLAADYFQIERDWIFEIGLTPNRSDAISHVGVARDLSAVLRINNIPCTSVELPLPMQVLSSITKKKIDITIENTKDCPRYCGLVIEGVKIAPSPVWLQNSLKAIGVRPINNVVDITNYVMFSIGQPLHAFDADHIKGDKIIIKNLPAGTPFVTLDGNEIKLHQDDLMVCDAEKGMCIAGVYGGLNSGITETTQNIFLESAYFHPVTVRKTSKRHGLKTDAAFRFERGCDPEVIDYAINRAALYIQQIAQGQRISDVIDVYPTKIERVKINLDYEEVFKVAGKKIDKNEISKILNFLEMELISVGNESLMVSVPPFKTDVTRPIDIIEEILRIYGYDNIEIPAKIGYELNTQEAQGHQKKQHNLSRVLANVGFFEIMNNSLTKKNYANDFSFINEGETINILNPISNELNVLRQTLLFSGLEDIVRNVNNKNSDLRLFEFGKTYYLNKEAAKTDDVTKRYLEKEQLALFVTGKTHQDSWQSKGEPLDFFYLKNMVALILRQLNIFEGAIMEESLSNDIFSGALSYTIDNKPLVVFGQIHPKVLKYFDLKKEVFYAEFNTDTLFDATYQLPVLFTPMHPYPEVERDLALVVDKTVTYKNLEEIAIKFGTKLLKKVTLFDVYEGAHLDADKKSYALKFILQHPEKTLTDEDINKVMNKLIAAFEKEIGAKLR
jgi:phenylalanyl-tRNA synthetase beta chain